MMDIHHPGGGRRAGRESKGVSGGGINGVG